MNIKLTISNILIVISGFLTIIAYFKPELYMFGINDTFLVQWLYHIYILQFFIWTFLHWSFLHFFANALFLYIFWNLVELIIWKNKFIIFFIFIVFFNWILLLILSDWNTIWISWFCMAIISYYTLELKSRNNMEYKWWITALIINIWIWIVPGISLLWHLFWAIWWVFYYLYNHTFFKRKLIWLFNFKR